MKLLTTHLLAATALALTASLSGVSAFADPENDFSNNESTQRVDDNALSTPLGLVDLNSSDTQTVDGTGLRALSNPDTDTVDDTSLRSESSQSAETVDGTGLRRSVTPIGTETVDGTGRLHSTPVSDSADSVQPEDADLGE